MAWNGGSMTSLLRLGLLACILAGLAYAAPAEASRRVALVIGNQNYANLPQLQMPGGDAAAYAQLFKDKGFDQVILRQDQSLEGIEQALADLKAATQPGDTAVFVYSGYGWSDGTHNYVVGTDAPKSGSKNYLARISVPLRNGVDGIIDQMNQTGAAIKVAIVDASRDNPFTPATGTNSIGIASGLSRMQDSTPDGTFIVFSAGPGEVALDRLSPADKDPNGLFARSFIPLLRSDLTLLDATKDVQQQVYLSAKAAGHEQRPTYYDETLGNVCLSARCGSNAAPSGPQDTASETAWQRIATSTDPADFESFARLFPDSPHALDAAQKARTLKTPQQLASAPAANPQDAAEPAGPASPDVVRQLQVELKRVGCDPGPVDGTWSKESAQALVLFNQNAHTQLATDAPSMDAVDAVRAKSGTICVSQAAQGNGATAADCFMFNDKKFCD